MITKIKNKEYLYFICARMLAMLTKPFLLWFLLRIDYSYLANVISLYFLVISAVMVIFNNEAHFEFYKKKFSGDKSKAVSLKSEKRKYFERLIYHIIIFSLIVFIITLIIVDDLKLSLLFFILLVLEKIFDEVQRLLQFKQFFKDWGIIFINKSIMPLIVCLIIYSLLGKEIAVMYGYFVTTILINLLLFYFYIKKSDLLLVYQIIKEIKAKSIINYFSTYRKYLFLNQLQSVSTRNVPLLDRLFIRFFFPEFLAQISIISQIGSISIMIIDYFLIAHKRKEYLQQYKKVFDINSKLKLIMFFLGSFLSYIIIVYITHYMGFLKEVNISTSNIILIGLYYSVFAIGQHFVNYNFWNIKRVKTLMVDVVYFLTGIISFFILNNFTGTFQAMFVSILLSHFVRLCLSIIISSKTPKLRA